MVFQAHPVQDYCSSVLGGQTTPLLPPLGAPLSQVRLQSKAGSPNAPDHSQGSPAAPPPPQAEVEAEVSPPSPTRLPGRIHAAGPLRPAVPPAEPTENTPPTPLPCAE